jgi:hypothetical protein
VRIGEADDLPGIAGVGENFLITGETGIENDFASAARLGARGAALKNSPVFQCECGGACGYFCQWALRRPDLIPVPIVMFSKSVQVNLARSTPNSTYLSGGTVEAAAEIAPNCVTGQYAKTALP